MKWILTLICAVVMGAGPATDPSGPLVPKPDAPAWVQVAIDKITSSKTRWLEPKQLEFDQAKSRRDLLLKKSIPVIRDSNGGWMESSEAKYQKEKELQKEAEDLQAKAKAIRDVKDDPFWMGDRPTYAEGGFEKMPDGSIVSQVIGSNLLIHSPDGTMLWGEGFDIKGLSSGKPLRYRGVVAVVGERINGTVEGAAKHIKIIEPRDLIAFVTNGDGTAIAAQTPAANPEPSGMPQGDTSGLPIQRRPLPRGLYPPGSN